MCRPGKTTPRALPTENWIPSRRVRCAGRCWLEFGVANAGSGTGEPHSRRAHSQQPDSYGQATVCRQPHPATAQGARWRGSQPMVGQTRTMLDGYAAGGRYRETVIGDSKCTTARSATYRYIPRYTLAAKGPSALSGASPGPSAWPSGLHPNGSSGRRRRSRHSMSHPRIVVTCYPVTHYLHRAVALRNVRRREGPRQLRGNSVPALRGRSVLPGHALGPGGVIEVRVALV